MGDLALDTEIEGSDGRYQGRPSDEWAIWGPMGGYIAAFALRAAGAHSGLARPAAFSCHFLSVAAFDTIDIEATTLRASKRAASTRVAISQEAGPSSKPSCGASPCRRSWCGWRRSEER